MPRDMQELSDALDEHEKKDEFFHGTVRDSLDVIKNNHLAHIQASMATMESDIAWITKSYWLVAGALVGILAKLFFK